MGIFDELRHCKNEGLRALIVIHGIDENPGALLHDRRLTIPVGHAEYNAGNVVIGENIVPYQWCPAKQTVEPHYIVPGDPERNHTSTGPEDMNVLVQLFTKNVEISRFLETPILRRAKEQYRVWYFIT